VTPDRARFAGHYRLRVGLEAVAAGSRNELGIGEVSPRPSARCSLQDTDVPIEHIVGVDNVDRRLLARFEASHEHERARRELLPPEWLNADRAPADHLGDVFGALVDRAREHVRTQREAAGRRDRERQSQA
jgi:hypothetical protein